MCFHKSYQGIDFGCFARQNHRRVQGKENILTGSKRSRVYEVLLRFLQHGLRNRFFLCYDRHSLLKNDFPGSFHLAVFFIQTATKPCQNIELPVGITRLFGVKMVGKYIYISLYIKGNAITDPEIKSDTTTSCNEITVIAPKVTHRISFVMYGNCFIVVKSMIACYTQQKISIHPTPGVKFADTVAQIKHNICIQLKEVEFIIPGGFRPGTLTLPTAKASAKSPDRRELIPHRQSSGR